MAKESVDGVVEDAEDKYDGEKEAIVQVRLSDDESIGDIGLDLFMAGLIASSGTSDAFLYART